MSYYTKIHAHVSCKYILIVSSTSAIITQRHYSQSLSRMPTRLKHTYVPKDNYLKIYLKMILPILFFMSFVYRETLGKK